MNTLKPLWITPAVLLAAVACASEPGGGDNAVIEITPAAQEVVDFTVRADPPAPPSPRASVKADTVVITQSDGKGEVKELHMNGDDVRVIVNGRVIEQPNIKKDGKHIIVLDQDGNKLTTFEYEGIPSAPKVLAFRGDGSEMRFGAPPSPGQTPPVMLGISLGDPGEALRSHLGLGGRGAILVEHVVDGTPAAEAGLHRWDVIVSIDGSDEAGSKVLHEALMSHRPGDEMRLWVIRGCKKLDFKVELAPYDHGKLSNVERDDVEIEQEWPTAQRFNAPAPPQPFVWRDQRDIVKKQLSKQLDGRQLEEAMRAFEEAMGSVRFGVEPGEGYGVFEFKWDGNDHKLVIPKGAPQWREQVTDQWGQKLSYGQEKAARGAEAAGERFEVLQHELEARMDRLAAQIEKLSRALERMDRD